MRCFQSLAERGMPRKELFIGNTIGAEQREELGRFEAELCPIESKAATRGLAIDPEYDIRFPVNAREAVTPPPVKEVIRNIWIILRDRLNLTDAA